MFVLAAQVLDRLLDLPAQELESARQAALNERDDIVSEYVREAARLSPFPGVIWRYCEEDAALARGTSREHAVPAGRLVALLINAANRDPRVYAEPERFSLQRAPKPTPMFGDGMHACMGEHIGMAAVCEIAKVVLAQPELRRAPGEVGRLRRGAKGSFPEGVFPASLCVELHHQNGLASRRPSAPPRAAQNALMDPAGLR